MLSSFSRTRVKRRKVTQHYNIAACLYNYYAMLLILSMFQMYQAKYMDYPSNVCLSSKSSLAVVQFRPVTDIRANYNFPN